MALIELGPWEKLINWIKGSARAASKRGVISGPNLFGQPKGSDTVWTKVLNKESGIEVIAREDGLFSFRKMKIVKNGPATFDIPIFESGLYSDLKEVTLAVTQPIETLDQYGQ